jgi:hypothetical protein
MITVWPDGSEAPEINRRRLKGAALAAVPMLSPYPGLDQPLSVQSWGHRLKTGGTTSAGVPHAHVHATS